VKYFVFLISFSVLSGPLSFQQIKTLEHFKSEMLRPQYTFTNGDNFWKRINEQLTLFSSKQNLDGLVEFLKQTDELSLWNMKLQQWFEFSKHFLKVFEHFEKTTFSLLDSCAISSSSIWSWLGLSRNSLIGQVNFLYNALDNLSKQSFLNCSVEQNEKKLNLTQNLETIFVSVDSQLL
jgi:hypothetical protein